MQPPVILGHGDLPVVRPQCMSYRELIPSKQSGLTERRKTFFFPKVQSHVWCKSPSPGSSCSSPGVAVVRRSFWNGLLVQKLIMVADPNNFIFFYYSSLINLSHNGLEGCHYRQCDFRAVPFPTLEG